MIFLAMISAGFIACASIVTALGLTGVIDTELIVRS